MFNVIMWAEARQVFDLRNLMPVSMAQYHNDGPRKIENRLCADNFKYVFDIIGMRV